MLGYNADVLGERLTENNKEFTITITDMLESLIMDRHQLKDQLILNT